MPRTHPLVRDDIDERIRILQARIAVERMRSQGRLGTHVTLEAIADLARANVAVVRRRTGFPDLSLRGTMPG